MFIHSYSFKPMPVYHGHYKRHLLLGIELEVDGAGEDEEHARQVLAILNEGDPHSGKNAYCKHDGSLEAGFEIVSQPATLNYHLKKINWQQAFQYLLDQGYRSGDTATCGLHVHFNCIFLGDSQEDFLKTEGKLLAFFEENWSEIIRFSRRNRRQIERWCKRYGHRDIREAYNDNDNSRYFAINFQNSTTDEIRIFKGTLRYETFIATLQFVHNLVLFCKRTKDNPDVSWTTFLKFVRKNPKNIVLIEYLQRRELWTL